MANLGNVGFSRSALRTSRQPGPAFVGTSYGRTSVIPVDRRAWNWYADPNQSVGNTFVIPSSRRVTILRDGRYAELSQGSSGAVFYDFADGTYYAHEADGSGLWQVSIAGGVPTVTQVTHGYGIGQGQRPVTVTSGHLQVLAPGDFLLGVAMNFPYQLSGGSLQQMALSSANTLPLILTNGTNTTLQVTLNG